MQPLHLLIIIAAYFGVLYLISKYTVSTDASNQSFFTGNRSSKWYLVAFGMIGTSLSGVTFISVPGWVNTQGMAYLEVVFGYFVGYMLIAYVLLPLFYKNNITSIYEVLEEHFGKIGRQISAFFFIVSRVLGASFRLYLVCLVLDEFILGAFDIPFWVSVLISLFLIFIYTNKGGIKTIVITDSFQTAFMLLAVVVCLFSISNITGLSFTEIFDKASAEGLTTAFSNTDWLSDKHFLKTFVGGILIAFTMTGLDQDMMQKNLSCKNEKESRRNIWWFSTSLIFVNMMFLFFGCALAVFANEMQVSLPESTDRIFPFLAVNNYLGVAAQILFVLGLVAAAYSSADSAVAALTTSIYNDILGLDPNSSDTTKRKYIQIMVCVLLFIVIVVFSAISNDAVIGQLLSAATFTYGPILALFILRIKNWKIESKEAVVIACLIAPVICYLLKSFPEVLGGYKIGYELLLINALLCIAIMLVINKLVGTDKAVNK